MKFLLDTHVLIWLAGEPERLADAVVRDLEREETEILFSAVNIWEISIKHGLGRADFTVAPATILTWARERSFRELAVSSEHGIAVGALAKLHKDPFDRLLLAQASVEDAVLLTSDPIMAEYSARVRLVR